MLVLVIDQYDICREGMKNILLSMNPDCEILEADTIVEGAIIAKSNKPDLIIIDMAMPNGNSIWVLDEIEKSGLKEKVVLLSTREERSVVCRAEDMGICAFIGRQFSKKIISSIIQIVLAGGRYFSPEMIYSDPEMIYSDTEIMYKNSEIDYHNIVEQANNREDPKDRRTDNLVRLSARQMEVLRILEQGSSNKVIARDLNIATGTVKVHVAGILKALKAKNRTQAVSIAKKINII